MKVNGRFVMGILGKRVRKYVIDSPISHGIPPVTVTQSGPGSDQGLMCDSQWAVET